jgi:hypothetical protein
VELDRRKLGSKEEKERRALDGGVGDGVLLLHGEEENMRKWFGQFIGDEKLNGEELTINGGWCSRDPRWMVKEVADDGDSWGKTTTRLSRLPRSKELAMVVGVGS